VLGTLLPQFTDNYPPVDDLISWILTSGVDPLLEQFVAADPFHRVPVQNGVSLVFGDDPVPTKYGTFTGAATVTLSGFQSTTSSFSTSYEFSATPNASIAGESLAITHATGQITASQSGGASLLAGQSALSTLLDVSVSGSGSNPPATESGNIHVDTGTCPNYPISGSLNITIGGDRYVISFTDACDGSFESAVNPPAESCNAGQQVAGDDTPDSRYFEMGTTHGSFQFDYETYSQEDQIQVIYQGGVIFDTGCVGAHGTVYPSFNGQTTVIQVTVTPNCAGGTGTSWNYTVHCPT
jgi:hypothetical protein